jgi:hypothetical protein
VRIFDVDWFAGGQTESLVGDRDSLLDKAHQIDANVTGVRDETRAMTKLLQIEIPRPVPDWPAQARSG